MFGSCKGRLIDGATFKEVVLNSGEGHTVLRLPDDQHLKLRKEPMLTWVMGE